MPIRFHCSHCRQRLSVASRKRGATVKCPRCGHKSHVPVTSELDQQTSQETSHEAPREASQEAKLEDREEGRESTEGPVAFFPEVAHQNELVYAREEPAVASPSPLGATRVAVPRSVLYAQGILLGCVALVFFIFGLVVGSGSQAAPAAAKPAGPVTVSGRVFCERQGQRAEGDAGSVILLLPAERRPDEKLMAAGLRPDDPPPPEDDPARTVLETLGGDYARADQRGRFRVEGSTAGRYFLVVISKHRRRPADAHPAATELARLGRYIIPPTELLGRQRYSWHELVLDEDKELDISF